MYAWMFSKLPGPFWVRLLISVVLAAALVLVLMEYVFPWADQYSPWAESTVGLVQQP